MVVIVFVQAHPKAIHIARDQQRSRAIGSQILIAQTDFPEKNGVAKEANQ